MYTYPEGNRPRLTQKEITMGNSKSGESLCGMCKDGWEKVWGGDYAEWQWVYCYDCSVVQREGKTDEAAED